MRSVALRVVLLAALVSGCSSSDAAPAEVGPLASGSASARGPVTEEASPGEHEDVSPSATGVSSAGPLMPAEARLETAVGAAAFATHYLALIGDAFARADSSAVRAATAEGCEGCDAIISVIDSLAPQGRRRVGGTYVVRDAVAPEVTTGDVIVLVSFERTPSQIVDSTGTAVESAPATPRTDAQMRLVYRENTWQVQGYRVV